MIYPVTMRFTGLIIDYFVHVIEKKSNERMIRLQGWPMFEIEIVGVGPTNKAIVNFYEAGGKSNDEIGAFVHGNPDVNHIEVNVIIPSNTFEYLLHLDFSKYDVRLDVEVESKYLWKEGLSEWVKWDLKQSEKIKSKTIFVTAKGGNESETE